MSGPLTRELILLGNLIHGSSMDKRGLCQTVQGPFGFQGQSGCTHSLLGQPHLQGQRKECQELTLFLSKPPEPTWSPVKSWMVQEHSSPASCWTHSGAECGPQGSLQGQAEAGTVPTALIAVPERSKCLSQALLWESDPT